MNARTPRWTTAGKPELAAKLAAAAAALQTANAEVGRKQAESLLRLADTVAAMQGGTAAGGDR